MDDNLAAVVMLVSLLAFAVLVVAMFIGMECYEYGKIKHDK